MALQIKLVGCAGDGHTGGLRDQFKLLQTGLTLYDYDLYAVEHWCAALVIHHDSPFSEILALLCSVTSSLPQIDALVSLSSDRRVVDRARPISTILVSSTSDVTKTVSIS